MARAGTGVEGGKTLVSSGGAALPVGPAVFYLAAFLVICPIVFAAIALNLPALIAGWYAGKKFPDGRNVVSLWKILVGVPVFRPVGRRRDPDPAAAGKIPVAGRILGGHMRRAETLLPMQETRGCGPQRAATTGPAKPDAEISPNGDSIAAP